MPPFRALSTGRIYGCNRFTPHQAIAFRSGLGPYKDRRIARQFSVPKATRYAEPKSLPQRGCDRREPTALFVAGSAERAHHVGHELGGAHVAVVREGEPEPYDDKLRRRHDDHILAAVPGRGVCIGRHARPHAPRPVLGCPRIEPPEGAVLTIGCGRRWGGHVSHPTGGQDALPVPDPIAPVEFAQAGPITGGHEGERRTDRRA